MKHTKNAMTCLMAVMLITMVAAITTSDARGTPATPLLVNINVNSIPICVPKVSGIS